MHATRALTTASLLAVAMWAGGLVALGAFAAPAVFGNVPAPWSGDSMTIAFRRFDTFAIACAVAALLCEVGLAMVRRPILRIDVARAAALLAMTLLALAQALFISPRIEALHRAGAIRGVGEAGSELHAIHERAKLCGRGVLLLALLVFALHVVRLTTARGANEPAARRAQGADDADEAKSTPP